MFKGIKKIMALVLTFVVVLSLASCTGGIEIGTEKQGEEKRPSKSRLTKRKKLHLFVMLQELRYSYLI